MTHLCTKCDTVQPITEFPSRIRPGNKNTNNWCRSCTKVYNKEYHKKRKEQDKDWRADYYLKQKYGITREEYDGMLEERQGKCDICQSTESFHQSGKMQVDHCHESNKVRGILCFRCNTALGAFQDNTELLKQAINYLEMNK
jgi:hypothetical protein